MPLEGPLPGGAPAGAQGDGASVVVEPMECGTTIFPPGLFEQVRGGLRGMLAARGIGVSSDDYVRLGCPVFLVEHPTVGAVLIDTGLHASIASDPRDNMGRIMAGYHELERGKDAASQLRERGLAPKDIQVVVMTHLHAAHASAVAAFPDATFVVSAPEWKEATESPSILKGYVKRHYDYAFDFQTVDFGADFITSYGPFGRTFDVFGDGTIRLVFTPGHTVGHCSVICRLPRRDFVALGDAAYNWRQIEGGPEPFQCADRHNWRRSLRELNAYRAAYPYALIVPGHDPEFFAKLDARYEE